VQPTRTRGVSSLLQGSKTAIIPQDSERLARRKQLPMVTAEDDHHHSNGNGCGQGSAPEATDLPARSHLNGNGHRKNGNGHDSLLPLLMAKETVSG
jgi:hypothetical protein